MNGADESMLSAEQAAALNLFREHLLQQQQQQQPPTFQPSGSPTNFPQAFHPQNQIYTTQQPQAMFHGAGNVSGGQVDSNMAFYDPSQQQQQSAFHGSQNSFSQAQSPNLQTWLASLSGSLAPTLPYGTGFGGGLGAGNQPGGGAYTPSYAGSYASSYNGDADGPGGSVYSGWEGSGSAIYDPEAEDSFQSGSSNAAGASNFQSSGGLMDYGMSQNDFNVDEMLQTLGQNRSGIDLGATQSAEPLDYNSIFGNTDLSSLQRQNASTSNNIPLPAPFDTTGMTYQDNQNVHRSPFSQSQSSFGGDDQTGLSEAGGRRSRASSFSSHLAPQDKGDFQYGSPGSVGNVDLDMGMLNFDIESGGISEENSRDPRDDPQRQQTIMPPALNSSSPQYSNKIPSPQRQDTIRNPTPPVVMVAPSPSYTPSPPPSVPPSGNSKPQSPPSLIIPEQPQSTSMQSNTLLSQVTASISSNTATTLFPPANPHVPELSPGQKLSLAPGDGPQINIVPSTPTSGQLASKIFSETLEKLNNQAQILNQAQLLQKQHEQAQDLQRQREQLQQQQQANAEHQLEQQRQLQQILANHQQSNASPPTNFGAAYGLQQLQEAMAQRQKQTQLSGANFDPSDLNTWINMPLNTPPIAGTGLFHPSQHYANGQNPIAPFHPGPPNQESPAPINPQQAQNYFSPLTATQQMKQSSLSKHLKAPPTRQRSKSESSAIPYDFGPAPPQAPTMDPKLMGAQELKMAAAAAQNQSILSNQPLVQPPQSFFGGPDESGMGVYARSERSHSSGGSGDSIGGFPAPPPLQQQGINDFGLNWSHSSAFAAFVASQSAANGGNAGTGGDNFRASHVNRMSIGGAFGPGTPGYAFHPQQHSSTSQQDFLAPIHDGGAGLRRARSDASTNGGPSRHRKYQSEDFSAQGDFLRSISRPDGTLGIPTSPGRRSKVRSSSPSGSAGGHSRSSSITSSHFGGSASFIKDDGSISPEPINQIGEEDEDDAMPLVAISGDDLPRKNVTTKRTADASKTRRKVEATFVCPVEGCGSTFTRHFNLKGHLRSHTDQRPFVCPQCGKGFARQHDCKRHIQLHVGHRPHKCLACQKTFARLDALSRHLRSEAGQECVRSGLMAAPSDAGSRSDRGTSDGRSSDGGGGGGGRGVLL